MLKSQRKQPYSPNDELASSVISETRHVKASRLCTYGLCINYFHKFKENDENPCGTKNLEVSLLHFDDTWQPTKNIYGRNTSLDYSGAEVIDQLYFSKEFAKQIVLENKL